MRACPPMSAVGDGGPWRSFTSARSGKAGEEGQVRVDRRAGRDGDLGHRLAHVGEVEHQGRPARLAADQPGPADAEAVFQLDSAGRRPARDRARPGRRGPRRGLRDSRRRRGGRPGLRARALDPAMALDQEMEPGQAVEQGALPALAGRRQVGELADASGRAGGLGIDQATGPLVPEARRAGSARRRCPAAPGRPAIGPARRGRRRPWPAATLRAFCRAAGSTAGSPRSIFSCFACSLAAFCSARLARPSSHEATHAGGSPAGTAECWPAQIRNRPRACLQGNFRLGHEQWNAGSFNSTLA